MTAICGSIIVAADEDHVQFHCRQCNNGKTAMLMKDTAAFILCPEKNLLKKRKFSQCEKGIRFT
jgi:hypothetical protein